MKYLLPLTSTVARQRLDVVSLCWMLAASLAAAETPSELANHYTTAGLIRVAGTVFMQDGSPAADAAVEAMVQTGERPNVARADAAGRFQLEDVFGNGAFLHASSANGQQQTTLRVPAIAVRQTFASPVELKLTPAIDHTVSVVSHGDPVAGVQVAAEGETFRVRGVTAKNGKVLLLVPASDRLQDVVVWHAGLGINAVRNLDDRSPQDSTQLSLRVPREHTLRIVDPTGNPIPDLPLAVSFRTEDSDWIFCREFEASHVKTDGAGVATIPWAPEKLKYVDLQILGDGKVDEIDIERTADGTTTVHARRTTPVEGRVVMPEGVSAEGILIAGRGSGPGNRDDIPYARARSDGTFTLRAASNHGYVLAIVDVEWAGEVWSGKILGIESESPPDIRLEAFPATPLRVRVTRGSTHQPVPDAIVSVEQRGRVEWVDDSGKQRSGSAGIGSWFQTDADGIARAAIARGEYRLQLSSGIWSEEKTLQPFSDQPLDVEFHRAWLGDQRIAGQLTSDGTAYQPSADLVARAWTPQSPYRSLEFVPKISPDGTFEVAFDAQNISLLFIDSSRQRSGFAQFASGQSAAEVVMQPSATYEGQLVDEQGQPISGGLLSLHVAGTSYEAARPQRTDLQGRFQFTGAAAQVPLQLSLRGDQRYIRSDERLFEPGETRSGDVVSARRLHSSDAARPNVPLARSVAETCRNAGLTHMRSLVLLQGDTGSDVTYVASQLLDDDSVEAVVSYLPLQVSAARLKSEAEVVEKFGWPQPGTGEIVLVVLDDAQQTIAAQRIKTDDLAVAVASGSDFLIQHVPPRQDALVALTEARKEAQATNRRVWIVYGGPRCGPCFRLARWMNDHRNVLAKDYVVVKVIAGVDEHVAEVIDPLPRKEYSIPWHAITEPDGKVLVKSEGPQGNIGAPGSVEGLRHFRHMLERTVQELTSEDVDGLIRSLSPDP